MSPGRGPAFLAWEDTARPRRKDSHQVLSLWNFRGRKRSQRTRYQNHIRHIYSNTDTRRQFFQNSEIKIPISKSLISHNPMSEQNKSIFCLRACMWPLMHSFLGSSWGITSLQGTSQLRERRPNTKEPKVLNPQDDAEKRSGVKSSAPAPQSNWSRWEQDDGRF